VARFTLTGYAIQAMPLARGLRKWICRKHGDCIACKTARFNRQPASIAETFTGEAGSARATTIVWPGKFASAFAGQSAARAGSLLTRCASAHRPVQCGAQTLAARAQ
jgi:hypothetical protein